MDAFISSLKTTYANWRIQPTRLELRSYNKTERVLLTFDDFTEEDRLHKIFKILKKEHIKAAFFLVGEWASRNGTLVQEIKNEGHWVGNHTKTHANLLTLDESGIKSEILGGPSSTLLRPPYGKYNQKIRKIAHELGYKICYWDIDSDDWQGLHPEEIIKNVTRRLHPGACILLHLNAQHTIEALPTLIKEIQQRGYEFCYDGKEIDL